MTRALGWLRDRFDPRDHLVALAGPEEAGALPSTANVGDQIVSTLDQSSAGTCVANSVLQCVRAAHVRQGIVRPELASRLFAYYVAIAEQGEIADTGTENRILLMQIRNLGYCPEQSWPYDLARLLHRPTDEAFREAFDQAKGPASTRSVPLHALKIPSVGAQRVADMKRMLFAGFEGRGVPITFGSDVSERFTRNDLDDPMRPPIHDAIAGGHDQTVIGYETAPDGSTIFAVLNSWGEGFGSRAFGVHGCSWWHESYFTWDGRCADGRRANQPSDLWCIESAPYFSTRDPA